MKKILLLVFLLISLLYSNFNNITPELRKTIDQGIEKLKQIAKDKPSVKSYGNIAAYYAYNRDYKEAIKWFKQSYKKFKDGNSAAYVGTLYQVAFKDTKNALKWMHIGVDLDGNESYYNLASVYETSLKNYHKALKWYTKAFNKGDKDAPYAIALLYNNNFKDYPKALKWFKKAVSVGDKKVNYSVGLLYKQKLKDYPKAIKWYKKAVSVGDSTGAVGLGFLYKDILLDNKKAEKWFLKAIEMGEKIKALSNLARVYEKEKRYKEAIKYYRLHAKKNPRDKSWILEDINRLEKLLKQQNEVK